MGSPDSFHQEILLSLISRIYAAKSFLTPPLLLQIVQEVMDSILKDERFARIATDRKFRGGGKKQRKVKIDKRFESMFADERFVSKCTVDKRGRPQNLGSKENYRKYYDLKDDEEEDEEEEDEDEEEKSDSEDDDGEKLEEETKVSLNIFSAK